MYNMEEEQNISTISQSTSTISQNIFTISQNISTISQNISPEFNQGDTQRSKDEPNIENMEELV